MTIDGKRVNGRLEAIVRELMRHEKRLAADDVTRITAHVSARGACAISLEIGLPRVRLEARSEASRLTATV